MRKASLVEAKAHLSELVDAAEHHGKRILILRHGKPAAAIVPVSAVAPAQRTRAIRAKDVRRSINVSIAEFSADDPEVSAVEDLIQGRR